VYIDATSVAAADRRLEIEVTRLIRTALHPFELQLERIQVQVRSSPEGHVCCLHARAERGHTIVVESTASSRWGAIESAAACLRRSIAGRMARGLVAAAAHPADAGGFEAPAPISDRPVAVATESAAQATLTPPDGSGHRPRVLLALHELDASNACLQWARALAAALQADLDVCRVLSTLPTMTGSPAGKVWLEATRRLLAATRETRRWCADVLPHARLSERLIPGGADIVAEAALRARQRGVDWIVMPAIPEGCGRSATALARAAGCPVLVAREPTSRSTLLVATDVCDDLHSICSGAAALAEALHAPVLAFHDAAFRTPEPISRVNTLTGVWAQIQAERMDLERHQRLPELEVLLAYGTEGVATILQQARREDAEILVVGASEHAASRTDELAASVIDRAIRSVLVVPSSPAPDTQAPRLGLSSNPSGGRRPPRAGPPPLPGCARRARWRGSGGLLRRPRSRRRR
jgi:nucleotide-binding universal stress UspA family protein